MQSALTKFIFYIIYCENASIDTHTDPYYDTASHYGEERMICHRSLVITHHSISSSVDSVSPN